MLQASTKTNVVPATAWAEVDSRLLPGHDASALPAPLRTMLDGGAPRAYLCAGQACAAPTGDPAELAASITTFTGPRA